MNTLLLYAAVLWLSLRERWYLSRWNPWGATSGRRRSTADLVETLGREWRAAHQAHGTPPSVPKPPLQ